MSGPFKGELHVQEYVYDYDVDGGAQGEIFLSSKSGKDPIPVGAVIKQVTMVVHTTFTSGGSATLAWGNDDAATGYSGAGVAVASLAAGFLANGWDNAASLLWDDTNDHPIPVYVANEDDGEVSVTIGTADMTAGKCSILVEYYLPKGV